VTRCTSCETVLAENVDASLGIQADEAVAGGVAFQTQRDQRAARADLAVIVSQAMPPDIPHFNEVDGIWVSSLACTLPVAAALRASLLQLASQKRNAEGQQTKSELVYGYLTGPHFRGRIEAIAERWTEMQKDLVDEKKATMKRWSKRESQLHTLIESTAGIYGDLQGIAGRDLAEIQTLGDMLLLEDESKRVSDRVDVDIVAERNAVAAMTTCPPHRLPACTQDRLPLLHDRYSAPCESCSRRSATTFLAASLVLRCRPRNPRVLARSAVASHCFPLFLALAHAVRVLL